MRTYSIYSVLFITASLTSLTTALPSTSSNIAVAQISSMSKDKIISENSISQVNVLFVNPSIGNDQKTNGSESTPLKTITQALRIAKDNTVIKLAKGTYSAETGEQFPLILKQGVSIEGDISDRGKEIIIQGGGEYLSRYYGSKNIGIVATGNSKLAGVTVTNPNPRGYGMWIELDRPVLEQNTFTGSTQDGVAVMGKAAPKIHNNYFYQNGANGITVSGKSQPEIKENIFQDTGFGINIAQNASPQIISNKISHNRTGIVVQAASRPVLRNNSIFNNKEDGLVVIAASVPDLGNSSNPGGNQFNFNGRYDINAKAAKQEVAAYGNTLTDSRVAGKVNLTATAAPAEAQSQLPRRLPTLLQPRVTSQKPSAPQAEEFNYVQVQPDTIEFTAPQAPQPIAPKPSEIRANTPSLPALNPAPVGESALLSIPTARIPVSKNGSGNLPAPIVFSNPATNQNPPQRQARTTQTSSYRVIVEAVTPRQQELVRFIVPDAFRTTRRGRRVMQAGIFDNRDKANNLIKIFKNNGLKARIEQ
jgi:parallel beta-helix repeat protein